MFIESNLSKVVSERATKVVIIIILSTLFALPFFDITTYFNFNTQFAIQFNSLITLEGDYKAGRITQQNYVESYDFYIKECSSHELALISLDIPEKRWRSSDVSENDLRNDEAAKIFNGDDWTAIVDIRLLAKIESSINIARTLFVCVLLGASSYYFNKDARELVLAPVDRMMERVNMIAKNPMALCNEDELMNAGVLTNMSKKKKKVENNEAQFLEDSLFKIGRLLGLCFGEAGAKIIGANISNIKGAGGDFNPLI